MKKYVNAAFIYTILAMVAGVFYREFTKILGYTGLTALSKIHTHLFVLGMVMLLVVALFVDRFPSMEKEKSFGRFWACYHIGLPLTAIMLLVRGVLEVLGGTYSRGVWASISGIAGIGHIFLGVGIVFFFMALKKVTKDK